MKKQLLIKRLKLVVLLAAIACWKYGGHSMTHAMAEASTAWQGLHNHNNDEPCQNNGTEEERTGKVSSILIFPFIK